MFTVKPTLSQTLASLPADPPYFRSHSHHPSSLTMNGKVVLAYLEAHRLTHDTIMAVLGLRGFSEEYFAEFRQRSALNNNYDMNYRVKERDAAIREGRWNPSMIQKKGDTDADATPRSN